MNGVYFESFTNKIMTGWLISLTNNIAAIIRQDCDWLIQRCQQRHGNHIGREESHPTSQEVRSSSILGLRDGSTVSKYRHELQPARVSASLVCLVSIRHCYRLLIIIGDHLFTSEQ